jgi:cytochrome c oxidase cbb3-type subunit 3
MEIQTMVKKFEKVKDELLDHDYDGVQELDNELPPWWLWLFHITII